RDGRRGACRHDAARGEASRGAARHARFSRRDEREQGGRPGRLSRPSARPWRPAAQGSARVNRRENLIWIDLEMTGLDPEKDRIIEIATVVTDKELTVLAEGPVHAIHQDDETLAGMDEWNTRQHATSGLTE